MNLPSRHFHRLAWVAVLLAFAIVVFGAFVRLSNAGLSCPDWPTCYGRATWPVHADDIAHANAHFERAVETSKTWREQFHRHLAATLGLLILILTLIAARRRPQGLASILGAAALVAISIPLYITQHYQLAIVLALCGETILLFNAIRWSNTDFSRLTAIALMVVIFQAVLGMWTVTWLLKPVVVMSHLLGGLATFSLLTWLAWSATPGTALVQAVAPKLRRLLWIGLVLLVLQIALGGWTSSNYAALACGSDFPMCRGQWWPPHDFHQAFVIWRGIGVDYEGGVLDDAARVAIQLAHRAMAVLVFGHLLVVAIRMIITPGLRYWGIILLLLICAQVALGISNVVFGLPLWVATAHTAGAALLLFVIVGLLARLRAPE
ncbi:MAG TPA: COX15/CtaA family protein [Arenimonas sp.]|uniref:COX15/CtaA family protein n=1 Tax=Arenimonas sp. TaxID=1872635 RepID=UPI002C711CF7|nr:COX15/CtaA family protein [Arenimonas sp.]HMB57580.1 COX15/CtaA family protein [Arenimonas sp.]